MGCLSPRLVAQEVQRYEESRVKNKDTYWMLFELNVRDYFRCLRQCWRPGLHLAPERTRPERKHAPVISQLTAAPT